MSNKPKYQCPKCGSYKVETTCMGIFPGAQDTNRALCHGCSWQGIGEDCKYYGKR